MANFTLILGGLYPGMIVEDKRKIKDHFDMHGYQMKFQGKRVSLSEYSPLSGYALLTEDSTHNLIWAKVDYLEVVEKKEGEPFGVDLITVVNGSVISTAGRFDYLQKPMRDEYHDKNRSFRV